MFFFKPFQWTDFLHYILGWPLRNHVSWSCWKYFSALWRLLTGYPPLPTRLWRPPSPVGPCRVHLASEKICQDGFWGLFLSWWTFCAKRLVKQIFREMNSYYVKKVKENIILQKWFCGQWSCPEKLYHLRYAACLKKVSIIACNQQNNKFCSPIKN